MLARLVNLILIPAIIVCPMGCGSGLCCEGDSALKRNSAGQAEVAEEKSCCCCHESANTASADTADVPNQAPANEPSEPPCQGICGGAVIENGVEFEFDESPLFSPATPAEFAALIPTMGLRSGEPAPISPSGGNRGRTLRTLHSSLIC